MAGTSLARRAMVTLLPIVLLPLLGSVLPLLWGPRDRRRAAWAAAVPAAGALAIVAAHGPAVFAGSVPTARRAWVPALGLDAVLRLDGLAWLFAVLVLGIGLLVILYARYYLSEQDPPGRFYAMLLLFMGAMAGLVLSGNLLLLVIFWELTSLSSFLLIGYWNGSPDARRGARMALAVTGGGGLALLAGIVLLGTIAGSFDLEVVLHAGSAVAAHPLYHPTLVLILLGVFTKSAQFPFHFWLPRAMAAPTPASAYLHSATMVKAGVFLLARFYPVLSGTTEWFVLVSGVGLVTLLFGAYAAMFKHDLKELLAYSTISHLGLITLLFGFGTRTAAVAAVFHIMNHATFKASLFMAAGIIDHEAGTRDMRVLNGLWRSMPYTGALAVTAAGAMAGVPLLNGFLSKELFFAEALQVRRAGGVEWLEPVLATLAGVFSVAYSVRFIHAVFFSGPGTGMPKAPHEPPRFMRIPVEVLVLLCVLVGVVPAAVIGPTLDVAAGAVLGGPVPEYSLALWHGFNLPLLMTAVALGGGIALYVARRPLAALHHTFLPSLDAGTLYAATPKRLAAGARAITRAVENGSLQRYVALLVGAAIAAGTVPALRHGWSNGPLGASRPDAVSVAAWLVLVAAALATVALHRRRLIALVMISAVGLMVALTFVRFSAPDLALTQLLVETVTILLVLLALHHLPEPAPAESSRLRRWRDAGLGTAAGAGSAALAWAVLTRPHQSISGYFLEQSVPAAGGTNVVNVILVDFRGFDTLGEISVLGIAALGILVMLSGVRPRDPADPGTGARDRFPLILATVSRPLLPLAILVSVFLLLRGHNLPGGGFIAALLTAVALILQYLANGVEWTSRRLRLDFQPAIAGGVLVAAATGAGSWLFGRPFLTASYGYLYLPVVGKVGIGSALLFDVGVYVAVVGAVMVILARLGRLSRTARAGDAAFGREASPWKP